jgi:hypothetical protein
MSLREVWRKFVAKRADNALILSMISNSQLVGGTATEQNAPGLENMGAAKGRTKSCPQSCPHKPLVRNVEPWRKPEAMALEWLGCLVEPQGLGGWKQVVLAAL